METENPYACPQSYQTCSRPLMRLFGRALEVTYLIGLAIAVLLTASGFMMLSFGNANGVFVLFSAIIPTLTHPLCGLIALATGAWDE